MIATITPEEAAGLRARITEYLANEGPRSHKRGALALAIGKSSLYGFMNHGRALSYATLKKADAALNSTPKKTAAASPVAPPQKQARDFGRLSATEAAALLAEVRRKWPKTADMIRALGVPDSSSSHWYHIATGNTSITKVSAERIRAALAGKAPPPSPPKVAAGATVESRPRRGGGTGRIYTYLAEADAAALREQVNEYVRAHHHGHIKDFAKAVGYTPSAVAVRVRGGKPITLELAARLRAGIGAEPNTSSREIVHVPRGHARQSQGRAPRNVLATLRLDAGHVLATKFGGNAAAMARDVGLTVARLSRFLDGGALTLEESAQVANRLSGSRAEMRLVSRMTGMEPHAEQNGEPEPPELRARTLVARWGREAIEIVMQLAQGGAA